MPSYYYISVTVMSKILSTIQYLPTMTSHHMLTQNYRERSHHGCSESEGMGETRNQGSKLFLFLNMMKAVAEIKIVHCLQKEAG